MTPDERVLKSVLIMYFEPKALHSKTCFLNIQNGRRAAILDPMTKLVAPDKRVLKRVLIMFFEPKALHAQFSS
jgi:hypothetical protein